MFEYYSNFLNVRPASETWFSTASTDCESFLWSPCQTNECRALRHVAFLKRQGRSGATGTEKAAPPHTPRRYTHFSEKGETAHGKICANGGKSIAGLQRQHGDGIALLLSPLYSNKALFP